MSALITSIMTKQLKNILFKGTAFMFETCSQRASQSCWLQVLWVAHSKEQALRNVTSYICCVVQSVTG